MSETPLLWLVPSLPLLGAIVAGFFGPKYLKQQSHWPVILGAVGACAVALWVLATLTRLPEEAVHRITAPGVTWFHAGNVHVAYSIAADPLTAIMLTAITFIGTLIAIFSVGYMHGDPGYARYFAVFSLFITMMCVLVLADNFLLLYFGWEGVGLCSYLLIGYWFEKPSAAAAARKAFLVTRIGDAGMILGIFYLWLHCGYKLDYDSVFGTAQSLSPAVLTTACLLLFCGAVGKSAQFPLHVWLPDAMEGPTPVSALIHAATMVTAGVYLVGRCMPLFILSPAAQLTVAAVAIITALLAALIALTQHDLKRVMAYSTVSQLGFMFLALGCCRGDLAILGVVAAIFHLFTHAFFKALLFLASGSVMHAMGNVIDMRRFGGLRHVLPVTHWTFLCGAAALAGFPFLSGFWSKDAVIHKALLASEKEFLPEWQQTFYFVLFLLALLTAALTAFYTFRAYFRTFWGELKIPPEAGAHGHGAYDHGEPAADAGGSHDHPAVHESPPVMTVPLIVLAIGAVCVGIIVEPITHWFSGLLARTPAFVLHLHPTEEHALDWLIIGTSGAIALIGISLAYYVYVNRPGTADHMAAGAPVLYRLSQNRFYLDEIYKGIVVIPAVVLAKISAFFDMLIDGIVDLIGVLPRWLGAALRPIQNGLLQFYALAMILGLAVFLGILTLRGGR